MNNNDDPYKDFIKKLNDQRQRNVRLVNIPHIIRQYRDVSNTVTCCVTRDTTGIQCEHNWADVCYAEKYINENTTIDPQI